VRGPSLILHSSVSPSAPDVKHNMSSSVLAKETASTTDKVSISNPLLPIPVVSKVFETPSTVKVSTSDSSYESVSSSSISVSNSHPEKRIESGLIQCFTPSKFSIYFESSPFWILALNKSFCDELHFPQYTLLNELLDSVLNLSLRTTFAEILSQHFGHSRLSFASSTSFHDNNFILINGSISYAETIVYVHNIGQPWIFVTDTVFRYRKIPITTIQLHRARHATFGGPTSCELLWATSIPDFPPQSTTMRRTIGDFVKYSIRPFSAPQPFPAYVISHTSLLPVGKLNNSIGFPSTFSRTGFGMRSLTIEELSLVFGLSTEFIKFVHSNIFLLPPIQILSSLLKQFTARLVHPLVSRHRDVSFVFPTPIPVPDDVPTYIESLQLVLPPTWKSDKSSAEKAAKADDATIDFSLWNDRILSLWSCFRSALTPLRSLVLRYQKRKLYLEFMRYIKSCHIHVYNDYLALRFSLYKGLFFKQHAKGDNKFLSKWSSLFSKVDLISKQNFWKECNKPRFAKLRKDLLIGSQALTSYLGSNYFSWDSGSSLLFWRWSPELRNIAKSGFDVQISGILPSNKKRARIPAKTVYEKLYSKILKGM